MRRTFLLGALLIVGASPVPDAAPSERHAALVPSVAEGERSVRAALEALASAHGLTLTIHGDAAWTVTTPAVHRERLDEHLRHLGVVNYARTGDRLIVFLTSAAAGAHAALASPPPPSRAQRSFTRDLQVTPVPIEHSPAEVQRLARIIDQEVALAVSRVDRAALEDITANLQALLP